MVKAADLKKWFAEKDETPKREFKLKYVLTGQGRGKYLDELAKDLIALTNTAGRSRDDLAYLVIGTGDTLRPDGTRDAEDVRPAGYDRQFFLTTANARCHPSIPDLSYTEIEVGGNYYGVVELPPSPHIHELSRDLDTPKGTWRKGSVLIRRGDGVGVASPQEMLLMKEEKEQWGRSVTSAPEQLKELSERALAATSELTVNWLKHHRLAGKPLIALQAAKLTQEKGQPDEMLNFEGIQVLLNESRRLMLESPAGRGKTTTLVQLASLIQDANRLSFLIDLREWAESDQDILDFIARSPEFRSHNINAGDLARLSKVSHFSFLLNGWNEISESNLGKAGIALSRLERSFPTAGIIIATRTHHISPPLPGALRVRLLPLTKAQRAEYLRRRLKSRADEFISKLNNDPGLDELTQTFLFLAEVATIFESGRPIPATRMAVLGEAVHLLEQSEEHRSYLQGVPLRGRASEYLEELATQMTTQGETLMSRQDACTFISSVNRRLRDNGQIEIPPDPDDVLNTLCDHHILERLDPSSDIFSFEHQQFQEFYSAISLKQQLGELVQSINQGANREFIKRYVNERSWEEPLCMIAEASEAQSAESQVGGELLVEMALNVDPIFAATLSLLCGKSVSKQVRATLGERLRSWYAVDDENHRQCAVAGMLASGSDEFSDIILPLLTSDDRQVRLRTYRMGNEFYLSSLGAKWRDVVRDWEEEARIDFIQELSFNRWISPEAVADFALADPSPKVKVPAMHILSWVGADQDLTRLLEALDQDSFEAMFQELYVEDIPVSLQSRVLAVCQKILNESADVMSRIQILLRLAALGDTDIPEKLRHELTQLQPDKISDRAEPILRPALKIVQSTEPEWVSHWIASQVADGSLRQESWMTFVTSIPEDLKAQVLEKISSEDLQYYRLSAIISVLAASGDLSLAEVVFAKLCDVRRDLSDGEHVRDEAKWAIVRQLEALFRSLPSNIAVAGLSNCFTKEFDAIELTAVIEIFSRFGVSDADLRSRLQDELRQKLRTYLKNGVQFALKQDDPRGEMKAYLATALARIGEPEDRLDLRQLIRADIERVSNGLVARARGERSELARWCSNRYDNLYVRAVALLDSGSADTVLLELLHEPGYEAEAASALVRLATIQDTKSQFIYKTDYRLVWDARSGRQQRQFDEGRRQCYADEIKRRITTLLEERANSAQTTGYYDHRLKELVTQLAVLDSCNSAAWVLEIIAIAGESNAWRGVEALENLLFGGAALPTEATLKVLNQVIEQLLAQGLYDNQSVRLLKRCLCLMPFVDSPSLGIYRLRQVLSRFPKYELPEIVTALGHSRCHEALIFLRELAGTDGNGLTHIAEEWINAVPALDGPESGHILLSFIDPDADGFDFEVDVETHLGELLASHIASVVRAEPAIKQRIFQLYGSQLSTGKRALLLKVIALLGTEEAILAGLSLMDDTASQPVPFVLWKAIETVFLERRPSGIGNSYTLVFRSSDEIRTKLFEMALKDKSRRRAAFGLLGQIETWRLEHGNPSAGSRHPLFDSGEQWPLIKAVR